MYVFYIMLVVFLVGVLFGTILDITSIHKAEKERKNFENAYQRIMGKVSISNDIDTTTEN